MQALAVLGAFVRRDWTTAVSYRLPFFFDLTGVLFRLTLFFFLGRLVDTAALRDRPDLERGYFAFVLIGAALLQIVQISVTSFAEKTRQEQMTGSFEALVATPSRTSLLLLSGGAYDLLRATALSAVTITLGMALFGLRLSDDPVSILVALAALAASIAIFAAVGVAIAAFTVVFKQSTALLGILVTALALLGGVWYPTAVLPAPLRLLADLVPFTWALAVLRGTLLRSEVDLAHLLLVFAAAAVAMPLALSLFSRALRRARRAGSLSQY